MEFYYIRFAVFWALWLILADKSRWREIFPVCLFASLLGTGTDIAQHYYPLWMFDYNASMLPELSDDFGVYIVITYLFIQWLPERRTPGPMLLYWFAWTSFTLALEWLHLKLGHMTYHQWWRIWHSYIADWLLFWIFYGYYRLFNFEKLARK